MARNKWSWVAILGLLMLIAGCSGGGGGDSGGVTTATITGTVFYNGAAAAGKNVTLYKSVSGQTVYAATTQTDLAGAFSISGVIPGNYQASCLVSAGVTLTSPEAGGQFQAVTLSGPNVFDIGQVPPPNPPVEP